VEVLGTTKFYIKSFKPKLTVLSDAGDLEFVYYLDLDLLHPHQYQRLIKYLSAKFNLPLGQVKLDLEERGIPIPAADCMVTICNPHKWLGMD
jgi:hypothetical protein